MGKMQQSHLEAWHMEAETRHKGQLRQLRAELVLAETRHANDMALHEAEAQARRGASTDGQEPVVADQLETSSTSTIDALQEAQAFAMAAAEFLQEDDDDDDD